MADDDTTGDVMKASEKIQAAVDEPEHWANNDYTRGYQDGLHIAVLIARQAERG